VSTLAVDTWRDVKIQTENLTEVPNGFLPLIQVPSMIQNKTEVLNLKSRKTQVPIKYLTSIFFLLTSLGGRGTWPIPPLPPSLVDEERLDLDFLKCIND
jgi:hypothetical protein